MQWSDKYWELKNKVKETSIEKKLKNILNIEL